MQTTLHVYSPIPMYTLKPRPTPKLTPSTRQIAGFVDVEIAFPKLTDGHNSLQLSVLTKTKEQTLPSQALAKSTPELYGGKRRNKITRNTHKLGLTELQKESQ